MENTIQVPKLVLRELFEACKRFNAAEDVLEDFLLTSDKNFINKMRRLRAAHKAGSLRNWQELKAKHGL